MKDKILGVEISVNNFQRDVSAYEDDSLTALRNAGYRITMPRIQVIRAIADTKTALSPQEIRDKIIAGDLNIDDVSVRRILTTLQEVGLVYYVGLVDGYFPCRLPDATRASFILVNDATGEILELVVPNMVCEEIQQQVAAKGYTLSSFKIEIMGTKL